MLIHSQHGKRNARSGCGKGSSPARRRSFAQARRAGHHHASGTPGQEGARLAELSRKVWLSLVQRVDLSWNECGGMRVQQTLLVSSLGLHPPWLQ